ncbi:glycoside hydrolase family 36 N-terminal domain-containing protein, partial [Streptomyces sp. NPDC088135]
MVLRTPNSVYAVRIGADGSPRHLHWGEILDTDALCGLPVATSPATSSFESDPAPDELAPQTGARFGPAGLQVRFADGTRGAQWSFTGHTVRDGEIRLQLTDRRYPLAAELCYRVRPGSDVIERWAELTHTGAGDSGPITVDRLDSASWTLPALPDYRLSHLVGGWNSEFQLQRDRLPVAETVLTSRRGVTSHHANPWLALDDGTADEEHGEIWSTALAWSGSWRITVHRDPVGRTSWTGGFGHEGLSWTIQPGQSLHTPVFAGLY